MRTTTVTVQVGRHYKRLKHTWQEKTLLITLHKTSLLSSLGPDRAFTQLGYEGDKYSVHASTQSYLIIH